MQNLCLYCDTFSNALSYKATTAYGSLAEMCGPLAITASRCFQVHGTPQSTRHPSCAYWNSSGYNGWCSYLDPVAYGHKMQLGTYSVQDSILLLCLSVLFFVFQCFLLFLSFYLFYFHALGTLFLFFLLFFIFPLMGLLLQPPILFLHLLLFVFYWVFLLPCYPNPP